MPTILIVTRLETSLPGVDVESEARRAEGLIRDAVTDHKVFDSVVVEKPIVIPDDPTNGSKSIRVRLIQVAFDSLSAAVEYTRNAVLGVEKLVDQRNGGISGEEDRQDRGVENKVG